LGEINKMKNEKLIKDANKIVEENFKGLDDLIKDADIRQFYKSVIAECMVGFATQQLSLFNKLNSHKT